MGQSKYTYPEFSGALQQKSTTHIRKPNELRRVKNVDFATYIGAIRRRPGAQSTQEDMPKLPVATPPLGAHIARFPSAIEIWAAQNDLVSSPTQSILRYFTGPDVDDWTDIKTGMPIDAEVNMTEDNDEVWVSLYSALTDTIGDPFTVDSSHNATAARNLQFAPKGRFYMEYAGAMWAANVLVNGVRYRDRLYKSSGLMGAFSFVRAPFTMTQTAAAPTAYAASLQVDSVRYLKPTMVVDIYQGGTETKLYTLTVDSVDKVLDTVMFSTPGTITFANTDITTASDQITLTVPAWMTTGTPVTFWMGTGLPGGLAQGTVYYVVVVDSGHIKLATTRANALAGSPVVVDITSQGTGTHRLTFTPVFGNKDEFWVSGRKGKLTRLWNTDYRNPEAADWLKLPPTLDASNAITAIAQLTGRMFWFTENSMIKYDGQNRTKLRNDVGCIAHKSIAYYDSFMAWLDAKGQIWVRNEEANQQDVISEAIKDTMASVPQSQLPEATAVCVGNKYKLYLGIVGDSYLRVVYDFKTNQWTEERFNVAMPQQVEYTFNGTAHPHFFDQTGQMWVDEEGDTDNGAPIPMEAELGDDTFGVDEVKKLHGIKVWSSAVSACKVFVSVDGGQFMDLGQLTKPVEAISLEKAPLGTMINIRIVDSASLAPVQVDKMTVWYTREEDTFRATK